MKLLFKGNPRYPEYDEYLHNHINGVMRAWTEMLKPAMLSSNEFEDIDYIDDVISKHDESKYNSDEYNAYCNYFYPCEGFEKDQSAFDRAWLTHLHKNPHHHQHWILIRDEGEKLPIDMPLEYICEMICDWHSFSLKDKSSTAYKWYADNKSDMVLSTNTVKVLESLLEYMKEPLEDIA